MKSQIRALILMLSCGVVSALIFFIGIANIQQLSCTTYDYTLIKIISTIMLVSINIGFGILIILPFVAEKEENQNVAKPRI